MAMNLIEKRNVPINGQCWQWGKLVHQLAGKSMVKHDSSKSSYDLDKVKGNVKLPKPITIPPFETVHVQGISKVKGNKLRINTITESPEQKYSNSVRTIPVYSHLKPGSKKVIVGL